jgi:hypothetical protein
MSNITAIAWQEQAICEKMIMMFAFYKINRLNLILIVLVQGRGGSRGAHPAHAPPPPPKIGKNKTFWRKIEIFHTKYPRKFRASLRSAPQNCNPGSAPARIYLSSTIYLHISAYFSTTPPKAI